MTDLRHQWDHRIKDWPTIRKIAQDLGLASAGHHFYCPGCQPLRNGTPELAIGDGHSNAFGAAPAATWSAWSNWPASATWKRPSPGWNRKPPAIPPPET